MICWKNAVPAVMNTMILPRLFFAAIMSATEFYRIAHIACEGFIKSLTVRRNHN